MTERLSTRILRRATVLGLASLTGWAHLAQAQTPAATPLPAAQAQEPQGPVVRLSMAQAVEMAMESNLGLQVSRLDLDRADRQIAVARSSFLPLAGFNVGRTSQESQSLTNPDGTRTNPTSTTVSGGTTVSQQLPWYGTAYSVTWGGNRNVVSGSGATFNPSLGASLNVNFSQPLWQGLRIDPQRANLEVSQRNRVVADLQLEQRIVQLDSQVRFAYLQLVSAIEQNKVANENFRVAEESLRQARARVEVGVSPEIEIIENEAQVEGQRVNVILTEAQIQDARDALRRLILNPNRPDYWTTDLQPTDTIDLSEPAIDLENAVANALANRLDLQQLRRSIEITDLNARVASDNIKPQVDLNVNLRSGAFGGTRFLSPAETERISYGTVLGDTFGFAYPTWTVGVNVGVPIGQTAARAQLAQTQILQRQQAITLRDSELAITEQVRGAAREVENSYRRVQALQASRQATERQLEAEERRFAVGLSTAFQLQQRQRDLFNSRAQEVNAMIAHQRALINFERVQKIN
ncbi:MAG TPA: TolC family protein [Vicinamibacterales bacterium]|nr:TolC family protein [Vicinamibacterales bacterium]